MLELPSGIRCTKKGHPIHDLRTQTRQIPKARAGIEPAYRSFADSGLTTWLPRHRDKSGDLVDRRNASLSGEPRAPPPKRFLLLKAADMVF